jgi:plasmid stabilization system protein ParE
VPRLVIAPGAFRDIDRLTDFLLESDPAAARETGEVLISGLQILKRHPLIGRKTVHEYRELVVSRGRSGYVALYTFDAMADVVTVLAIRHQREGGYTDRSTS